MFLPPFWKERMVGASQPFNDLLGYTSLAQSLPPDSLTSLWSRPLAAAGVFRPSPRCCFDAKPTRATLGCAMIGLKHSSIILAQNSPNVNAFCQDQGKFNVRLLTSNKASWYNTMACLSKNICCSGDGSVQVHKSVTAGDNRRAG
jgi:hypothetical protein